MKDGFGSSMTTTWHRQAPAVAMPTDLRGLLAGYEIVEDIIGEGGASVFRLHPPHGGADLFLKTGSGSIAREITDEMVRLDWLRAHLPTPQVRYFQRTSETAWMLIDAIAGSTIGAAIVGRPGEAGAIVTAAAHFLRRLHAIPVAACPFIGDLDHRLVAATHRIEEALIDEADFDDERAGWSARQVFDAIRAMPPLPADVVVSHGDFTVDNLLIDAGAVSGCIDVGRLGVADRYQDIALFWRDLGAFDPLLRQVFLETYGIEDFDGQRRDLHLMLDELF